MNSHRPLEEDTLYYLLKAPVSGDLLYIFSDYSHPFYHIPQGITGKCIYLHHRAENAFPNGFKAKRINGLNFLNTAWKDDSRLRKYQICPDRIIKIFTQDYSHLLLPNEEPLLQNCSVLDLVYAVSTFSPRQILPLVMERCPRVGAAITNRFLWQHQYASECANLYF